MEIAVDMLGEEYAPEEKPKSNMPPMRVNAPDDFQTPPHAVRWLVPYLPKGIIWEGSCGKGNIVRTLQAEGREVIGTDIKTGHDFLRYEPEAFDLIVMNPPYSIKDKIIARCYALCRPFALLMPLGALGEQERIGMYRKNGISLLMPPARINYETPSGEGTGAQFFSAWFCHGIPLPNQITFIDPHEGQGELL